MPAPRCLLPLAGLALLGAARGASFVFPDPLPGFTGRSASSSFTQGGPIATVLKREDAECNWVGIYEYQDGQAATAGLTQWLTAQHLTPRDYLRTEQTVIWYAEKEGMELLGNWIAPTPGQAGRLEMCERDLIAEESVRIPGQLIALLLGAVGVLGSAAGGLYNRLRGTRAG